jgi:ribosome-binding protein aMBF1 (putative translation factor)
MMNVQRTHAEVASVPAKGGIAVPDRGPATSAAAQRQRCSTNIPDETAQMYSNPQRLSTKSTKDLRKRAGQWLRELREKRGLSQRDFATKVGAEYYTFISQLETGRGRIPPDRYLVWADALEVDLQEFVRKLMSYYDPVTYGILFEEPPAKSKTAKRSHA